jgi:hypothetical protein
LNPTVFITGKSSIPKTAVFQYSDILMAPVRLLDDSIREFYNYRLVREELRPALARAGIPLLDYPDLDEDQRANAETYYRESVEPMYMLGRRRTASRPPST